MSRRCRLAHGRGTRSFYEAKRHGGNCLRMLLERRGRTQLLAAGASGQLVELYGDGATPPMGWAAASLRLLVREAVSPAGPSA